MAGGRLDLVDEDAVEQGTLYDLFVQLEEDGSLLDLSDYSWSAPIGDRYGGTTLTSFTPSFVDDWTLRLRLTKPQTLALPTKTLVWQLDSTLLADSADTSRVFFGTIQVNPEVG
jgi:hypothetical protein